MTPAILIFLSYGYTLGLVLLFGSGKKPSDSDLQRQMRANCHAMNHRDFLN